MPYTSKTFEELHPSFKDTAPAAPAAAAAAAPPPPPDETSLSRDDLELALVSLGMAGGTAAGFAEQLLKWKSPPAGETVGAAAKVREELAQIRDIENVRPVGQSPFERASQGAVNAEAAGTTGRQRQAVYNRGTGDEARSIRGQQPLSEFQGRRIAGASPSGIAIPASEMDRNAMMEAQRKVQTDIELKERQLQRAMKTDTAPRLARASYYLGKIPGLSILAGTAAGYEIADAIEQAQAGNVGNAVLSGVGGLGSAAALVPHPATRMIGTGLGLASGLGQAALGTFRDSDVGFSDEALRQLRVK